MSLFESLAKGLAEQVLGGATQDNNLLAAVAHLINGPEIGGIAGLAVASSRCRRDIPAGLP